MIKTPALPNVHLAIMQPAGYVHSLGLVDPARFIAYQLRRFGVDVSIATNRLRSNTVNLVLGAHLGFPAESRARHACLFVNLEQLGPGGAQVSQDYLTLLQSSGVVDYDLANIGAYAADPADVPLIPFRHAPYLARAAEAVLPLEERPIDLLFFGSMNERRRRLIARIEACGLQVATFDHPLYADERDQYIRQAKAVLNCHFYESATFEQVRAFQCLSLGTPVISERCSQTRPDPVFDEAITWFDDQSLEAFFGQHFGTQAYSQRASQQLHDWRQHDPVDAYADLMAFAAGYFQAHTERKPQETWQPVQVNLRAGADYKLGWLNLDLADQADPDLALDLSKPLDLPVKVSTRYGDELELQAASVDCVLAPHVLHKTPDLPSLMTNVLAMLKEGGEFSIEVPYEGAPTAWQDHSHVRALNEHSWTSCTERFWNMGWFEHRFELVAFEWLDLRLCACERESAAFMKLRLRKKRTSPQERTIARAMTGRLPQFDEDSADTCTSPPQPSVPAAREPSREARLQAAAICLLSD